MHFNATQKRDRFSFSLRGVTGLNTYAQVPVVPDDLGRATSNGQGLSTPGAARTRFTGLEDFLARYYAATCL